MDADVPPSIINDNAAIAAAASATGVGYFDAAAAGWFADAPDLIGADGVHPTDDGHAYLAEKMLPLFEQLASS